MGLTMVWTVIVKLDQSQSEFIDLLNWFKLDWTSLWIVYSKFTELQKSDIQKIKHIYDSCQYQLPIYLQN